MRIYGLIGDPVNQSPSPAMMNAAFKHAGVDAVYIPIKVPEHNLEHALTMMDLYGISGFNVTAPLKVGAARFVDALTGPARVIQAVNVVERVGRRLIGYNTDVSGLMGVEIPSARTALVVGAGGAARAACFVLDKKGVLIYLTNRTADKAKEVAKLFKTVIVCDQDEVLPDILVNATPLPIEEVAKRSHMPREMIIDYPYHSSDKRFLTEAADAGIKVIDGFDLLIRQALDTFTLWTGVTLEEEVMRKAIEH